MFRDLGLNAQLGRSNAPRDRITKGTKKLLELGFPRDTADRLAALRRTYEEITKHTTRGGHDSIPDSFAYQNEDLRPLISEIFNASPATLHTLLEIARSNETDASYAADQFLRRISTELTREQLEERLYADDIRKAVSPFEEYLSNSADDALGISTREYLDNSGDRPSYFISNRKSLGNRTVMTLRREANETYTLEKCSIGAVVNPHEIIFDQEEHIIQIRLHLDNSIFLNDKLKLIFGKGRKYIIIALGDPHSISISDEGSNPIRVFEINSDGKVPELKNQYLPDIVAKCLSALID